MSITDELREWSRDNLTQSADLRITAIADRIDAEHKKACDDAWDNGYEADYLGIEKWLTEHPQVMEHHSWVRLPKDADGEYIHIGDVVVGKEDGEDDFIFEVYEIAFFPDGSCSVRAANDYGFDPWQVSHYHAPTVEDVLREFAEKITDSQIPGVHPTYEEAIAEYAAELQLREVDE